MDETIGAKGGHNDRRRSLIIDKNKKKKLKEFEEDVELRELERKVKKQNRYVLIRTLPFVIGGGIIKEVFSFGGKSDDKKEEKKDDVPQEIRIDLVEESGKEPRKNGNKKTTLREVKPLENDAVREEEIKDENKKEEKKIITLPDGTKVVVYVSPKLEEKTREENAVSYDDESYISESIASGDVEQFDGVSQEVAIKIEKLKSRKIVDEYEKQLKDIRYELRKTIFEYNVLVEEADEAIFEKEAEVILDKLSEIIEKIELLKSKMKVEDLDKYDDNYIYTLIEGYLKEFSNGNAVKQIKDSPLYIMISKKLDEIDHKKDEFGKKVEEKKEMLAAREIDFEEVKKKYYSIDKINSDLLNFQNEQDRLLREIKDKVRNATSVREKVEVQFQGLNIQGRRLRRLLAMQMFLRGPRSARALSTTTAAYLYFYNNMIRPRTVTRKYNVITVKDYHDDIVNSIDSIDDALKLLDKTGKQIDVVIKDIETRFKDYIGVVSECDELLSNLRKIKSEISEKEYEMEKIKEQQQEQLRKNDAKVKTMGEYPVNQ